MLTHTTISIDFPINDRALYERIWRPEAFLEWASGLCGAGLKQAGEVWVGEGMEGPLRVRFSPHNEFGVMDHWVSQAGDADIYVPMRVVPNQEGCAVLLTFFRQPGVTEEMFAAEVEWGRRDLVALQELVG